MAEPCSVRGFLAETNKKEGFSFQNPAQLRLSFCLKQIERRLSTSDEPRPAELHNVRGFTHVHDPPSPSPPSAPRRAIIDSRSACHVVSEFGVGMWCAWFGYACIRISLYTSLHLYTPQYTSVHLSTPQCTSVHLNTPQYTSVYIQVIIPYCTCY